MSITVERLFRVTTPNGAVSDLTENEARGLACSLLGALGVAPLPQEAEPVAVTIAPPPQLAGGTVWPANPRPASYVDERGLKMGDWKPDMPELRRLMDEGVPLQEIAARLNRPVPATSSKYYAIKRANAPSVVAISEPEAPDAPESPASPVTDWTTAQTKALIREMSSNGGNLRVAAERTGHTTASCFRRWKHLKDAGIMRIEDYLKSQESTA